MNELFSLEPSTMSPIGLFLQADIVVKAVMIGLIAASIWTWAIIIGHGRRLSRTRRELEQFEREDWGADIEGEQP